MELTIPDGAQIHITYGHHAPVLALPGPPSPLTSTRSVGRSLLNGGLAAVVLAGAFMAGRLLPHGADGVAPARASILQSLPAASPASDAAAVPASRDAASAVLSALGQRPQVEPAPGQPATQAPAAGAGSGTAVNPFGLHE